MSSRKDQAKTRFLERIQASIDAYAPILEQEFDVRLGKVDARELKIGRWFHTLLEPWRQHQSREFKAKHDRSPGRLREAWFTFQFRLTVILLWIPVYI